MLEDLPLHEEKPPAKPPDPAKEVAIDVNVELRKQYRLANEIIEVIRYDPEVPANQKAQIINTVLSTLKAIQDRQEELHNLKQLQAMEATLVETLRTLPQETQQLFLTNYEAALAEIRR